MPTVCLPFPKVTSETERKTAGDVEDEFPRPLPLIQTHTSGGMRKCACVFVLTCLCLHLCSVFISVSVFVGVCLGV